MTQTRWQFDHFVQLFILPAFSVWILWMSVLMAIVAYLQLVTLAQMFEHMEIFFTVQLFSEMFHKIAPIFRLTIWHS